MTIRLRRLLPTVAAVGAIALAVTAPAAGAVSAARPGVDGWWQSSSTGPPVPATGLAVAATGGEPTRIAAIGLDFSLDPGATLERLELILVEHGDGGSNVLVATPPGAPAPVPATPAAPAVVACPAISQIEPARGGPMSAAPRYDCTLGRVPGARSSNGTWIFDITPIAKSWLGSLPQHGVVLVEAVTPPGSFQVVYKDVASGGVRVDLTSTIAEPGEPPTESFTSFDGGSASFGNDPVTSLPFDDPRLGETGFGAAAPPLAAPVVTAPPATTGPPAVVTGPLVGAANGRVAGNLPALTVLLVPVVLAAAALLSYVLGPAGDPAASGASRRTGAVSRALAGRDTTRSMEDA